MCCVCFSKLVLLCTPTAIIYNIPLTNGWISPLRIKEESGDATDQSGIITCVKMINVSVLNRSFIIYRFLWRTAPPPLLLPSHTHSGTRTASLFLRSISKQTRTVKSDIIRRVIYLQLTDASLLEKTADRCFINVDKGKLETEAGGQQSGEKYFMML